MNYKSVGSFVYPKIYLPAETAQAPSNCTTTVLVAREMCIGAELLRVGIIALNRWNRKCRYDQPPSNCLMKTTISSFSIVPELSLSKVPKTSSNASCENSSPEPRLPSVSWTNFFVSSLSSAPDLSTSYVSQIWSMTP